MDIKSLLKEDENEFESEIGNGNEMESNEEEDEEEENDVKSFFIGVSEGVKVLNIGFMLCFR